MKRNKCVWQIIIITVMQAPPAFASEPIISERVCTSYLSCVMKSQIVATCNSASKAAMRSSAMFDILRPADKFVNEITLVTNVTLTSHTALWTRSLWKEADAVVVQSTTNRPSFEFF